MRKLHRREPTGTGPEKAAAVHWWAVGVAGVAVLLSALVGYGQLVAIDYPRDTSIKDTCLTYADFVFAQEKAGIPDAQIDRVTYELSFRTRKIGDRRTLAQMCGSAEALRQARDSQQPLPTGH